VVFCGFSLSSTGKLGRVVELVWAAESLLGFLQVNSFCRLLGLEIIHHSHPLIFPILQLPDMTLG
jgi:hypothetical protein